MEYNLSRVKSLLTGVEIRQLDPWHYRIFADVTVDYWPSRDKAWITGTQRRAQVLAPEQVAAIAMRELLPEGATEHMKAL